MWCGDYALEVAFSDLFNLARCKNALVADLLEISSDSHQWNVCFLRAVGDWEMDLFTSFFNL